MRKIIFILHDRYYLRLVLLLQQISGLYRMLVPAMLLIMFIGFTGCEKLVEVPAPATSITQDLVFASDGEAISALAGAYYKMVNTNVPSLTSGAMTIYGGLSSDELVLYDQSNGPTLQFYRNALQSNNPVLGSNLWEASYQTIYQFNAVLEGVRNSRTLSPVVGDQLTGQALAGRALAHYNLTCVFGAVPYITSTDWRTTRIQPREALDTIYTRIIKDLTYAKTLLPVTYTMIPEAKMSFNYWAASALLARVYALTGAWQQVFTETDKIIGRGDYSLAATPGEVFLLNSPEAILQFKQDNTAYAFNATREGMTLLPFDGILPFPPYAYLSASLLSAFESGDERLTDWTRSREIEGKLLQYPAKYKTGPSQAEPGAPVLEPYMVLRLAEMILLRAEASLQDGNLPAAIADLNLIRQRASLPPLAATLSATEIERAIRQERRIELCCEWGHRWIDLRRWNIAETELTANKGHNIAKASLLWPIPSGELLSNPVLTQNSGY